MSCVMHGLTDTRTLRFCQRQSQQGRTPAGQNGPRSYLSDLPGTPCSPLRDLLLSLVLLRALLEQPITEHSLLSLSGETHPVPSKFPQLQQRRDGASRSEQ